MSMCKSINYEILKKTFTEKSISITNGKEWHCNQVSIFLDAIVECIVKRQKTWVLHRSNRGVVLIEMKGQFVY